MTACAAALLAAPAAGSAQTPCEDQPDALAPSRDLYCIELVAAPGISGVSGVVELGHVPGPFGVAVSPEGYQLYDPRITIAGLPDPAALGPYAAYVAWLTTPVLSPMRKLAEVRNGTTRLPRIAFDKFMILVTAEPSADVAERGGRLVLRGQSPSARMRPPDVMELLVGAMVPASHPTHSDDSGTAWPRPPMPPGLAMLPAVMALNPGVTPYVPEAPDPETIPFAAPREVRRLADGDTLTLVADYVRRRIKGRVHLMFGFNGQYPGPLVWVPKDATIIVEFTNKLDLPTSVHWHGVRLDNRFDGVPFVTQPPVPPGERFRYRVRVPDAGIYWYHPHHREDIQQDLGLYGNLVVRSPDPEYYGPAHREELLMLDDLLIGPAGLIPHGREAATHALMGRFGNVLLINGEPSYNLTVRRGEVVRLFFTNAANTRTFNLSLPRARLKLVGADIGNFERETWVDNVVLGPAERYVVHARFDAPGTVYLLNRVQAIDHLYGRFFAAVDTLGAIRVEAEQVEPDLTERFESLRVHPDVLSEINAYRRHFDRPVDRALLLTLETDGLPFVTRQLMQRDSVYFHPVEWSGTMPVMNWAATGREVRWVLRDPATGKEDLAIDWRFRVGDVVKIRLSNAREVLHAMQHPIHIHGQRFLVLAQNGIPNDNLAWKDTILLPVGGTADILLELSNPGRWMLHCHIAEHIAAGMKMVMEVEGQ